MRTLFCTILAATACLTISAQAQTIKAKGPAAAGVCAGALDLAAGMTAKSNNAKPAVIANMQSARDFFAEMPQFDRNEISANATAFVRLMGQRTAKATTDAERQGISAEIMDIAKKCFASVEKYAVKPPGPQPQPGVVTQQPQPGVVTQQPQPIQPNTTQPMILQADPQPLTVQPLNTEPLNTQPLVITPQ